MDHLIRDLRFAVRTLIKNRGFALLAVATLGLGIGANTAVFSAIDGVLLKPLPYTNGNRLVVVRQSAPLAGRPDAGVSIKELYDYRDQTHAFDALVEYHQMNFDLLKRDPRHPSLQFKKVGKYWSVHVGLRYRALAVQTDDTFVWFWIGPHADYDRIIG